MTNPTRAIFTPEVILSSDELGAPTTLLKATRSPSKRKFSFPATLHSSSLLTSENALGRTTRRLSNVSDRVTDRVRKLSTAMGWHHSPSKDILISQGKYLITLYIRFRLKRSGILNQQKKKVGLQKMQRCLLIGAELKDVFVALKEVNKSKLFSAINQHFCSPQAATVLEAMHTKVYTHVSRQLSSEPNNLENPEDTAMLLTTFGQILFKNEVNWGKIVSLFSVTAGLSIDLVRQNREDNIPTLIEGFLGVLEDELIPFLSENNGWIALHNKLQSKKKTSNEWSLVLVLLTIFVFFILVNNYLVKF
jgi:hypothetical protein